MQSDYVDEHVKAYRLCYDERQELDEEMKHISQCLIEWMQEQGTKSVAALAPDGNYTRLTKVESTTVKYRTDDLEERIVKECGPDVWESLTHRVLDESRLEDAVSSGLVPLDLVADCADEVPRKPYIRLSKVSEANAYD